MRIFDFLELEKDNLVGIVRIFLKKINVPVTDETIKKSLMEHPNYPSLLSISDSLEYWNVENVTMQVDKEKIMEMSVPFIAHFNLEEEMFVVVDKISEETVEYTTHNNKRISTSSKDFLNNWSGVALFAEANEKSGEVNFSQALKKQQLQQVKVASIPVVLLLFAVVSSIYWWLNTSANNAITYSFLSILNLIGVFFSVLLLSQDLNLFEGLLDKVCSPNKKINCKAVLSSKGARLGNLVSWSELGFIYFTGSFLFSVLSASITDTIGYLAWLNLFSLPFIVYSIIYQWKVVRQWCTLCLGILVLLSIQGAIFLLYWTQPYSFSYSSLLPFILCFILPSMGLGLLKSILLSNAEGEKSRLDLARFKKNKEVFQGLIYNQPTADFDQNLGLILGNQHASKTLIKVCSPFCGPCSSAHPYIEEILKVNQDLKVQIIFSATTNEDDLSGKVAMHMVGISKQYDTQTVNEALNEWYGMAQKDYDTWAAKYKLYDDPTAQKEELERMMNWCKRTQIQYTPTFFVNQKKLPQLYSVNELKYLV